MLCVALYRPSSSQSMPVNYAPHNSSYVCHNISTNDLNTKRIKMKLSFCEDLKKIIYGNNIIINRQNEQL